MQRSVRYNELAQMVDKEKLYTPEEAMALVKKASKAKFESVLTAEQKQKLEQLKKERK